jgi:hypothetical protein
VKQSFFSAHHLRGAAFGTDKTDSVIAAFFSVTVRMFLLAEVLVLALAMFLAVIRSLPGPVFSPSGSWRSSTSTSFEGSLFSC